MLKHLQFLFAVRTNYRPGITLPDKLNSTTLRQIFSEIKKYYFWKLATDKEVLAVEQIDIQHQQQFYDVWWDKYLLKEKT